MVLNQTALYALRALVVFAQDPSAGARTATQIADKVDVPVHYLSKILRRLTERGLLRASRGPRGGYTLALPPQHVRLLDVLVAIDYPLELDVCAFGWGTCNAQAPCPLHPAWSELNQAVIDWASRTTLAHISSEPHEADAPHSPSRRGS